MRILIISVIILGFSWGYADEERELTQKISELQQEVAKVAKTDKKQAQKLRTQLTELTRKLQAITTEKAKHKNKIQREIQELIRLAQKAEREGDEQRAFELWEEVKRHEIEMAWNFDRPKITQEVFEFFEKFDRDRIVELQTLEKDTEEYNEFLRDCFVQMFELKEFQEKEPQNFERILKFNTWEREIDKLVESYKSAEKEERKKIKENLQKILEKIFHAKMEERKQEIDELANELKDLQKEYDTKMENKPKIIERRVDELLQETDFEW